jgi:MFS family permease
MSGNGKTADLVVRRATLAVYLAFFANGFAFASWAARIPQVRTKLDVEPGELGLILLAMALGSIIAMPLSGWVVTHIGTSRAVAIMSVIMAGGLATVAIGYQHGVVPTVIGLFFAGFGSGTWDVAMNVQGATVEQRLGRAIMPRFHAGWSIGTFMGALLGSLLVAVHVGVTPELLGVAVFVAVAVPLGVRHFVAVDSQAKQEVGEVRRSPFKAWTEPRTLLIGVFVLCFAFTEGTGNDWLGVAMIDGYHSAPAIGSFTFAIFVGAMTIGRWIGPGLIDKHGRVAMLRSSAVLALAGLLVVVFSGTIPTAMVGAALWGLGASLGFPVGMSAASDDSSHAAARVSVVASIGYAAFLAGPPLIGFLGDHLGVRHALTAVAVLLGLAALIVDALRPLPVAEPAPDDSMIAKTIRS